MDFITSEDLLSGASAMKDGVGSLIVRSLADFADEKSPSVLATSTDRSEFIVNSEYIWLPAGDKVHDLVPHRDVDMLVAPGQFDYDRLKVRLCSDDEGFLHNEHSYAIPPHLRGHVTNVSTMLLPVDTSDCSSKSTDMNDADQSDIEVQLGRSFGRVGNNRILSGSSLPENYCGRRPRTYERMVTIGRNGLLPLNDEEKRMCEKEGVRLPLRLPLTKNEERIVKRIRRKIRNKRSAQESRKRKQAYVEALEVKVQTSSDEIVRLQNRLNSALMRNKELEMEVARMQANGSAELMELSTPRSTWPPNPSHCMTVFLVSVAIAVTVVLNNCSPGILRSLEVPGEDGLLVDEQYLSRIFNADFQSPVRPLPLLYEHDVLSGLYGNVDSDHQLYAKDNCPDDAGDLDNDDIQHLLGVGVNSQSPNLLLDDINFDDEFPALNRMEPYGMDDEHAMDSIKLEPFDSIGSDVVDNAWSTPLSTSLYMD